MCFWCFDEDDSTRSFSFDWLQLCDMLKEKMSFHTVSVRCITLPRACFHAHMIKDEPLWTALGSVLNVSIEAPPTSSKTICALATMRGYMMGVLVSAHKSDIAGGVFSRVEDRHSQTVSENATEKLRGKSRGQRGWCAIDDGGTHHAFVRFFRQRFREEHASHSLSLAEASSRGDLHRRVPPELMNTVYATVLGALDKYT